MSPLLRAGQPGPRRRDRDGEPSVTVRATRSSPTPQLLRNLLPPLAPPLSAHEDAELRVPAVRDVSGFLEVVATVLATLLALRLRLQDRVVGEVPKLDGESLVD